MKESKTPSRNRRSYPAAYEKLIPLALGIIGVATIIVIGLVVAIALRLLPGVTP